MKPVIPARKQALKDKKNEKSAQISNSTTGLTECHHFVFRRSWFEIFIKDSISLRIHFVVILSGSKTTSEQQ
jgi:hypothetical protein